MTPKQYILNNTIINIYNIIKLIETNTGIYQYRDDFNIVTGRLPKYFDMSYVFQPADRVKF
jgi:hypothetical protein